MTSFKQYFQPPAKVHVSPISTSVQLLLLVVILAGLWTKDPIARAEIVSQVGKASNESGFFQVINHDISEENLIKLQWLAHDFFKLPMEVKESEERPNDFLFGYNGRFSHQDSKTPGWICWLRGSFLKSPMRI